jgi:hypothetical protein
VNHVYFNGSALVDKYAHSWTMNGTVGQVPRSGRTPPGAGPFSDENQYQYDLGSGSDVMDTTGDFWGCVVFYWANNGVHTVVGNGANGVTGSGWYLTTINATDLIFDTNAASSAYTRSTGTGVLVSGTANVACFGRAGTTQLLKVNGATTVSTAGAKQVAGTTWLARLGNASALGQPFPNTIYEFACSVGTTPTTQFLSAITQRVKARLGISAW